MLCDKLEGWDEVVGAWRGGSRGKPCVYLRPIHIVEWQRPTQYCKAIILQLKKKTPALNDHLFYQDMRCGWIGRERGS